MGEWTTGVNWLYRSYSALGILVVSGIISVLHYMNDIWNLFWSSTVGFQCTLYSSPFESQSFQAFHNQEQDLTTIAGSKLLPIMVDSDGEIETPRVEKEWVCRGLGSSKGHLVSACPIQSHVWTLPINMLFLHAPCIRRELQHRVIPTSGLFNMP